MEITENDYFKERLDQQIEWYDKKSQSHQKSYKWAKRIEFVLAALIPLLSGFSKDLSFFSISVGILGAAITVIEGLLSMSKHHENWIEYRSICETLKQEKYTYLTRTGVYRTEYPFVLLVERVENIISRENVNWANINSKKPEAKKT